jgi:hypothetical protein
LSYVFSKKTKHNSRINISVNNKIEINSPGLCFGIKRQYQKLGAKIYLFLARNIIYAGPAEMENHF